MQLPDELLESVSGGTFTYNGKIVQEMESSPEGTSITMRDGSTASLEWNDQTKSRLTGGLSSILKTVNEIDDKHFSETATYDLKDYVK